MKLNIQQEIMKLEFEICRGNEMIDAINSEIVELQYELECEGALINHNRIGTLKQRIMSIIDANISRRLKIRKLKSRL